MASLRLNHSPGDIIFIAHSLSKRGYSPVQHLGVAREFGTSALPDPGVATINNRTATGNIVKHSSNEAPTEPRELGGEVMLERTVWLPLAASLVGPGGYPRVVDHR